MNCIVCDSSDTVTDDSPVNDSSEPNLETMTIFCFCKKCGWIFHMIGNRHKKDDKGKD